MTNQTLYLRDELAQAWAGRDVFSLLATLPGEVFRDKEGRRTLRFELGGRDYFLKYHAGVGWPEIVKNLLSLRLPIISAHNEWRAIMHLRQLGIGTMQIAGYGEIGRNPATRRSFVITDALSDTMSLEYVGEQWRARPPSVRSKRALLDKLADIAATMHRSGMNHRDFYLCHFLLDAGFGSHNSYTPDMPIYLIDLHRAQLRRKTPKRWLIKDLGSLYFSASRVPLTRRDRLRFICRYSGLPLRRVLREQGRFWAQVAQRAEQLLAK